MIKKIELENKSLLILSTWVEDKEYTDFMNLDYLNIDDELMNDKVYILEKYSLVMNKLFRWSKTKECYINSVLSFLVKLKEVNKELYLILLERINMFFTYHKSYVIVSYNVWWDSIGVINDIKLCHINLREKEQLLYMLKIKLCE
jgi:hypothetical protein